jgi:Holliday junction DNA helicase RuvA
MLITVSGVGPNTARMILSSFTPNELIQVIANKNEAALTSVKGIGSKTAQRILVDLKNKVKTATLVAEGTLQASESNNKGTIAEEAIAALTMLGFQKIPSQKVVASILKDSPEASVEQVIKAALRML